MDVNHFRNPKPIKHREGRKPTLSQRRHLKYAQETLMRIHMHVYGEQFKSLHVPDSWESIEDVFGCQPKKGRVTMRLDEAVLKYFRHQGRGYQELINQILRSYVELRLAKILESKSKDTNMMGEAL